MKLNKDGSITIECDMREEDTNDPGAEYRAALKLYLESIKKESN